MTWGLISTRITPSSQLCMSRDFLGPCAGEGTLHKRFLFGACQSCRAGSFAPVLAGILSALHYMLDSLSLSVSDSDVCGHYGMHLSLVQMCAWHARTCQLTIEHITGEATALIRCPLQNARKVCGSVVPRLPGNTGFDERISLDKPQIAGKNENNKSPTQLGIHLLVRRHT